MPDPRGCHERGQSSTLTSHERVVVRRADMDARREARAQRASQKRAVVRRTNTDAMREARTRQTSQERAVVRREGGQSSKNIREGLTPTPRERGERLTLTPRECGERPTRRRGHPRSPCTPPWSKPSVLLLWRSAVEW